MLENFLGKKRQENGQLTEKRQDRKSKRTWQKKNERRDRKGESNDSPKVPDKRLTSDIPGLPLGFDHAIHLNGLCIYLNSSGIHLNSWCVYTWTAHAYTWTAHAYTLEQPMHTLEQFMHIHLNSSCIHTLEPAHAYTLKQLVHTLQQFMHIHLNSSCLHLNTSTTWTQHTLNYFPLEHIRLRTWACYTPDCLMNLNVSFSL